MARSSAGGLRDLIISSSAHAASGDVWGGSWDNNRAQRNPSTVLKRNYAIKQQMSLFWMEPALGDAVMSSVRSVSLPDSSHRKACLLEISHMTAGGAKAVLTRLLPLAVVLFVNGLVSFCRLCGSCCA